MKTLPIWLGATFVGFVVWGLTEPQAGGEGEPMWGAIWCVLGAAWAVLANAANKMANPNIKHS